MLCSATSLTSQCRQPTACPTPVPVNPGHGRPQRFTGASPAARPRAAHPADADGRVGGTHPPPRGASVRTVRRTATAALAVAVVTSGLAVPAQAEPRPDRTIDV